METILSNLFPDFTVSRLPPTVLGHDITPLTANAPTAVDVFDYHIDADPPHGRTCTDAIPTAHPENHAS